MIKTNEQIDLRAAEIMNQITAFEEEKYDKKTLLIELLKLQKELKTIVFNDERAEDENLRIWDVAKQLEILNEERGNIANDEVENAVNQCKYIGNMIARLITGGVGKKKVFFELLNLKCPKAIIKNIDLAYEGVSSGLDEVVVTSKGVFLIEVKNTGKDIYIDSEGNYYRNGNEILAFDCSIGAKMKYKKQLLENAAGELLKDKEIHMLLVFTNSDIKVENNYKHIKHCFLNQLPNLIEGYDGEDIYSEKEIKNLVKAIESAQVYEEYPLTIDVNKFKYDFSKLLAVLEFGEIETDSVQNIGTNFWNRAKTYLQSYVQVLENKKKLAVITN